MKLSEYRKKLNQNSEFVEANEKLQYRFHLAKAVLRARIERNWSQEDLAQAMETKQANISRIEAGLSNPTLDFLQRLCEVLDLELNISFAKSKTINSFEWRTTQNDATFADFGDIPMRVDNRPDNVFCGNYDMRSKSHSDAEGELK